MKNSTLARTRMPRNVGVMITKLITGEATETL